MLVLSRHKGQEVIVRSDGTEIRCMVVDIQGDKVRLGFEAPKDVTVHRKEVQELVDANEPRIVEGRR